MNICPCCKTTHDSTACPTPSGEGLDATSCSHFVEWLESKAEEYNQIERGCKQWNLDRDNYRRMAWAMHFVKETFLNENAK